MSGYGLAAGAVISAIGAGTSMYAQNQNQKNQNNQLAQNIEQEQNLEKEGANQVAQTTSKVAQANANGPAQQLLQKYQQALTQANPTQAISSVPGGSKRYAESAASAKANVNDYANAMASNSAITGGAQLSRIGTGNDIADTASNLGLLNGQATNASGVLNAQLKGDQANPWTTALGSIVQGVGSGVMGRSIAGMGGAAKTYTTAAPGLAAGGTDLGGGGIDLSGGMGGASGVGSMVGANNPYLQA